MPVDYTIAARNALSNTAPDFANMLAQYQMMGARAQQQELAQLQMQKLQQEQMQQNSFLNTLRNLDISSPEAANVLARGGNLAEALQVQQAQRQAATLQAQEAAQRATAEYHRGVLGIAQAKLPFEQEKLRLEGVKEERLGESAQATREKTQLEKDAELFKSAENTAAKIVMAGGKGYDSFYKKLPPQLQSILDPNYNEDALTNFTTQMSTIQDQIKRRDEFDLKERINPETGLKETIAIPKFKPGKGATVVPGSAGAVQEKFGFMPGPENTGTAIRTNPYTGTVESVPLTSGIPAPRVQATPEGKLTPRVDMAAPPGAPANVPEPIPGTPEFNNRRFGRETLTAIGFNPKTGDDNVSKLIDKSTSGGLEAMGSGVSGFFGRGTQGAKAIAELGVIVNDVVLKRLNDKLGAQISDPDREFIVSTLGNVTNASLPKEVRLAAWKQVRQRLERYAGESGTSAAPSDNRPSLGEIFK
jgi:hypothetical protein